MTSSHETSRSERTSRGRSTFCRVLIILAFLCAPRLQAVDRPADSRGRTVAIGDVHGDFDSFVNILERTGLIDDRLRWTGGTATLVQTGDLMDRGPKVRQVLDLLITLEDQAAQAGGRVIVLLGNHEVMNVMRDVRDVAPPAAAFTDNQSATRQDRAYREYVAFMAERRASLGATLPVQTRENWLRSHPPGSVEYADAFGADGIYGRWLRSKKVVTTIGDTAFLHAGIDPSTAPGSLEAVNRRVRDEIHRFDEYRRYLIDRRIILPSFTFAEIIEGAVGELNATNARSARDPGPPLQGDVFDQRDWQVLEAVVGIGSWDSVRPDGPLWFRGFATWSDEEGASLVRKLQDKYTVAHWIVGHTITETLHIRSRFGSQVFLIDTGMMTSHYPGERSSALEIRDGRFTAISGNEQTVLLEPAAPSKAREASKVSDAIVDLVAIAVRRR